MRANAKEAVWAESSRSSRLFATYMYSCRKKHDTLIGYLSQLLFNTSTDTCTSFYNYNEENSQALIVKRAMVNESIDHENDVTFDITKGKLKHEMIQIEYFHSPWAA